MTASRVSIPLYVTPEHPCPYLPGELATTAFIGTEVELNKDLFTALLQSGYRRSGNYVYRPRCERCAACLAVRIPSALFIPTRSQKRCLKRNEDLSVQWAPALLTEEHFTLYQRYIDLRHYDGDMFPAEREQFFKFLMANWCESRLLELRCDGLLVACAVIDISHDGYSAVYSFFSPELEKRSLGTYVILSLIAMARLEHLPYVYLGYYISNCRKMNYKQHYHPLQFWQKGEWKLLPAS